MDRRLRPAVWEYTRRVRKVLFASSMTITLFLRFKCVSALNEFWLAVNVLLCENAESLNSVVTDAYPGILNAGFFSINANITTGSMHDFIRSLESQWPWTVFSTGTYENVCKANSISRNLLLLYKKHISLYNCMCEESFEGQIQFKFCFLVTINMYESYALWCGVLSYFLVKCSLL